MQPLPPSCPLPFASLQSVPSLSGYVADTLRDVPASVRWLPNEPTSRSAVLPVGKWFPLRLPGSSLRFPTDAVPDAVSVPDRPVPFLPAGSSGRCPTSAKYGVPYSLFQLPVRPVSPNTHGKSRDDRQEKLPLRRFFPPSTFAMSLWHGRQKARKCSARSIVPEVLPDTARRVLSLPSPAPSPEVPTRWTDGQTAPAPPEKPATLPCVRVALSSSAVPHTDWFLSSRR